jgi:RimJ/RimL family protein N-acetyltransferase
MDENTSILEVQRSGSEYNDLHLLKRIPLTKEYAPRIEWLWNKLKEQDYAFDDLTRGNSKFWMSKLVRPDTEHYEFNDDGYCVADGIIPGLNANVHFAVWGKPAINAIIAAGKELLNHLYSEYKLNRVTALCPTNHPTATRFATMLRFRYEGELRGAFLFHGKYYNVSIYKRETVN